MSRLRIAARAGAIGLVTALLVGTAVGASSALALPTPLVQAATSTATSSAVTLTNQKNALVSEDAPFPDLKVTVSQTKDLVSQGIRVTWTGGKRSAMPSGTNGGSDFLQIAQCWGEDPKNPGHPDRRTCQYGGTLGYGAMRDGQQPAGNVAEQDRPFTVSEIRGRVYTGIPFVAANDKKVVDDRKAPAGRVVTAIKRGSADEGWEYNRGWVKKAGDESGDLNTNRFFTQYTTNEVKWAPSAADGTGSVPFEVQTAMQTPALGCGEPVTRAGKTSGTSCWLVIIPRGERDSGSASIDKSGLWWDAWEHHLAVKLDFKPLGVRCEIGAAERQVAGSELPVNAIASWQPQLCTGKNGAAFVHRIGSESDALRDASGTEPSALALSSLPLDTENLGLEKDPLVYAPLAISGVAISFAVDSTPNPFLKEDDPVNQRRGLPMTSLKLTPRLIAKLLTASYTESFPVGTDKSRLGTNPRTIVQDQDFLQHNGGKNGEWAKQSIVSISVSDALVPDGRSDLATRLWEYVADDPEAAAWLNGKADAWGTIVNPYYSTNAQKNPTKTAFSVPRDNFAKADPTEKPDETKTDLANGTGAINLVTWRPYTSSFSEGAYDVLRGDGRILGDWDKFSIPNKFGKAPRQLFGSQSVIALTTSPAAEQYQTVTAALRNPAGKFVTPTRPALSAAAAAMVPTEQQKEVVGFDQQSRAAKSAPKAYPLAMPVYAALNPAQDDPKLRATYASFIRFAAKKGQTPGTDLGELPPGYAPLPKAWRTQALEAADLIEAGISKKPEKPKDPDGGNQPPGDGGGNDSAPPADDPDAAATPDDQNDPATRVEAAAGGPTPDDPQLGALTIAVPAGLAAGVLGAAAVPLVGRFRRRT